MALSSHEITQLIHDFGLIAVFLAVSAVAALAWSALITLEYYFVGHTILGAPTWLQIVLIIVGVLATIASFRFLRLGSGVRGRGPTEAADVSD